MKKFKRAEFGNPKKSVKNIFLVFERYQDLIREDSMFYFILKTRALKMIQATYLLTRALKNLGKNLNVFSKSPFHLRG